MGVDQSAGMLAEARARGLAEALEQVGLQELAFDGAFDAVMCVDAMENVPPEDWPLVLANLHRAVRPGGPVYLTIEVQAQAVLDSAFTAQVARGLPVVRGELTEGDAFAGYHYYPDRDQVAAWINAEGLEIAEEAYEVGPDGTWGYRHFLLRPNASSTTKANVPAQSGAVAGRPGSGAVEANASVAGSVSGPTERTMSFSRHSLMAACFV